MLRSSADGNIAESAMSTRVLVMLDFTPMGLGGWVSRSLPEGAALTLVRQRTLSFIVLPLASCFVSDLNFWYRSVDYS